jgi:pre-rRNA-processing protein TSR4
MQFLPDMQPSDYEKDAVMSHAGGSQDPELEDEEVEDEFNWVLGFAESPLKPLDLLRHTFPSKVGGRPAWLDPVNLPHIDDLRCPGDGSMMKFLLQVYAPMEDNSEAFHRTLFVFISPHSQGLHASPPGVQVLRCQLPRSNAFYEYDPPDMDTESAPKQMNQSGCDPWAVGEHEQAVVQQSASPTPCDVELFPEYEIVIEDEPASSAIECLEELEEENMKKLASVSHEPFTEEELPSDLVNQIEKSMPLSQRHFAAFAARVSAAPSQILRYCFEDGASPMCPSPEGIPSPDSIPLCPHCKGPRKFEFQIMPQLLNILGVDPSDDNALDWGTIAIYSCAASCTTASEGVSYSKEYAWVQQAV